MPIKKHQPKPLLLLLLYSISMVCLWFHGHESGHTSDNSNYIQEEACEDSKDCNHRAHFKVKILSCDWCQLHQKLTQTWYKTSFYFKPYLLNFRFEKELEDLVSHLVLFKPARGPPVL